MLIVEGCISNIPPPLFLTWCSTSLGHPVSQPGEKALGSEPAVCQQHGRLSPATYKRRCRDCFSRAQGLPGPASCCLRCTSAPASPLHPLHSHCRLQRPMVWSCPRPVGPTAESHAGRAPARQHLPSPGPLPSHTRRTGPDSRAGLPSDQRSAEFCQQPRRPQPEDHIGLGVRAVESKPNWRGLVLSRLVQVD